MSNFAYYMGMVFFGVGILAFWIFLISIAYMLIEILFLKLGLYEHHWWKTYMTGITVFIFLAIVKKWCWNMYEKKHKLLRYITFFFVAYFFITIPIIFLSLLGKQHYRIHWFENLYRDGVVFSFFYHSAISIVYTYFVLVLKSGIGI
jgi:chromate transport protein ChrA